MLPCGPNDKRSLKAKTIMGSSHRLALDTNAFSRFMRGDAQIAEVLDSAQTIALPVIVLAELRAGFAYGSKPKQYNQILDTFLQNPHVEILHITDETVPLYAELYARNKRLGQPVSPHDYWIAALCIQRNFPLLTFDKDFDSLPSVRRFML